MKIEQLRFCEKQIKTSTQLRPLYTQFTNFLKQLLHNLVERCSVKYILEGRTKTQIKVI